MAKRIIKYTAQAITEMVDDISDRAGDTEELVRTIGDGLRHIEGDVDADALITRLANAIGALATLQCRLAMLRTMQETERKLAGKDL